MPMSPRYGVVKHLRRAALLPDGAGQSDGQLLAWFLRDRDEAAFEALVRRHGPMVMSVCRRLLRNYHDAEDAFQATFLVLVNKAASIVPPEKLAGWLHGVAYHTALKAKATSVKRSHRERQVPALPEPEAVQQADTWHELLPLLDRELSRLPEKYRLPIILCDLEGRPIKEAACHLGWPQGTLAGRLARARAMLAKRLARHGPVLSGGALAAVLYERAASASVPGVLVGSTVKAAALLAAGHAAVGGLISVQAAALTEGVVLSMLLNKLKTVIVVLVVLLMGAWGGGWVVSHAAAKGQQERTAAPHAKPLIPRIPEAWKTPVTREAMLPSFIIKTRLFEVAPDGRPRLLSRPEIHTRENQSTQCGITDPTAALLPNLADACRGMPIGTRFAIKVKRGAAGKAQIDVTLSAWKIDKAEQADTLMVGNGVRAVKEVDLGKPSCIVVSHDHQANPQLWLELTVNEGDVKPGPVPRRGVDAPSPGTMPARNERSPDSSDLLWPFID